MNEELLLDSILLGSVPERNAVPVPVHMVVVREVTADDLVALTCAPNAPKLDGPPPAERMRARHHALARSIAIGSSDVQASAETGYSPAAIGRLRDSPAFQELVAYYTTQVTGKYMEAAELRLAVGVSALEELQDRLDDDEARKKLTVRELRELVTATVPANTGAAQAPQGGAGVGQTLVIQFTAPAGQPAPQPRIIDISPGEGYGRE